jgi:hypothetical protein
MMKDKAKALSKLKKIVPGFDKTIQSQEIPQKKDSAN